MGHPIPHDPKLLRIGDVFLLKDSEYTKVEGLQKISTRTLRYSRPCIVLSVSKHVATVIPMTTKSEFQSVAYRLHTDVTKKSWAILSQVTTIDISNLTKRIGCLRHEVLMDIRRAYNQYINGTEKIERILPIAYNDLDIIKFSAWNYYMDKNTKQIYLVLEAINKELIAIPVTKEKSSIYEYFAPEGYLNTDMMEFVGDRWYVGGDFECVGALYSEEDRRVLTFEITTKFSIRIIQGSVDDDTASLSRMLHVSVNKTNYMEAWDICEKEYLRDGPVRREIFGQNPAEKLSRINQIYSQLFKGPYGEMLIKRIQLKILCAHNIMACKINYLEQCKKYWPKTLDEEISKYLLKTPDSTGNILDDEIIQLRPYRNRNIKWIVKYIYDRQEANK